MPFELSDPKINRLGRPAGSMNKITRISLVYNLIILTVLIPL